MHGEMTNITNGHDNQPALYPFRALLVCGKVTDSEGEQRRISIALDRRSASHSVFSHNRPVSAAVMALNMACVRNDYTNLEEISVWGIEG